MLQPMNKSFLVIGAARSGLAAAEVLHRMGGRVTLTDAKTLEQLGEKVHNLGNMGINLVLGRYPDIFPGAYDTAVVSPGVPLFNQLVEQIVQANIPLIGELELAYLVTKAPFIAITGTNGKTTTTALTGQIVQDAGKRGFVGGNIGIPLVSGTLGLMQEDIVVAEVSSFQLETIKSFQPRVAMILNITPDHLDRHGSMEAYIAAKARIFENQQPDDFTVLNYDDPIVRALAPKTNGKVVFFSRKHELSNGVHAKDDTIVINLNGEGIKVIHRGEIFIRGAHNLENALAATAAAYCMGISPQSIGLTLKTFTGVAHRQELVATINGVTYINDSKGTNPDSTIKALEAYEQPIILIAGGKNKGSDFLELAYLIKQKVRALVLVGEAAPIIKDTVESIGFTNIYEAKDFPDTVTTAHSIATPGDIVLLSPACASWDMFDNFEDRGNLFKSLVQGIRG